MHQQTRNGKLPMTFLAAKRMEVNRMAVPVKSPIEHYLLLLGLELNSCQLLNLFNLFNLSNLFFFSC